MATKVCVLAKLAKQGVNGWILEASGESPLHVAIPAVCSVFGYTVRDHNNRPVKLARMFFATDLAAGDELDLFVDTGQAFDTATLPTPAELRRWADPKPVPSPWPSRRRETLYWPVLTRKHVVSAAVCRKHHTPPTPVKLTLWVKPGLHL